MNKLWTTDEIDFLTTCIEAGWSHKDIANEINRSDVSIRHKVSRLKISSASKWTNKDVYLLRTSIEEGKTHKEISIELNRSPESVQVKASSLKIRSLHSKILTNNIVDKRLENRLIKRIGKYVNNSTKIDFQCLKCDNIWQATTGNILNNNTGCPYCAEYGFNDKLPAVLYCIYFEALKLYKVGISNNYQVRLLHFSHKPEIIFIREFEVGKNAKDLEIKWLKNIKDYKINTGLLKSGNTETFRYEDSF